MKKMLKAAAIVLLALAAALGCNKEVEKTEAPPKASQVKQLVLVNLGSYWDWYAVPPDPGVFWEYPRLEQVKTIDVTDWEPGEDAVELGGSSSQWRDARDKFYYPWQGEDTIHYFMTGPYLWVNGKMVGARLWEVFYGDIPNPEDIVTVVADPSEVRHFKHLPNLEAAHVIIFPGEIDELYLLKACIEGLAHSPRDFPKLCEIVFNLYLGWIELHYIGDNPRIYLTSKPMHGIWFFDEEPSNYDIARFSRLVNIRGLDIGSYKLEPSGLSRLLPRFKGLRQLSLAMPNIDERILSSVCDISTLRRLTLQGGWSEQVFDREGLRHLEKLDDLTELRLSSLSLNDTAFMYISRIPNLSRLDIELSSYYYFKESNLRYLEGLTKLIDLRIDSYKITDSALVYLEKIKTLERLELSNTKVTDEGVARLKKALPQCSIICLREYPW
ncbi:hypothetical protein ES703_76728 [subsurface metagenome]|nr:hypothetical protein [bacterium]